MMTSQEILQAFRAGKISLEEAKEALTSIETSQAAVPDTLNVACGLAPQAVQPSCPTQSPDQPDTHEQVASVRMPVVQGTQARQGLSLSAAASQVLPVPGEHLQASEPGASKAGQDSPYSTERKEAIAIVGMSGKYPAARNLTEYWENLVQGKNAIREIPLTRFDVSHYYDPTTPAQRGKISCKWLGALDEIEYFDPLFFHLSPAEAEGMDPQQRLFLEEGYKAFEDAGYSPQLLSNRKCGVYLGIMSHEYDLLLHQHGASEMSLLGGSYAIAAARIAYLLNLKGPAIAIDTACSSSLVATHLACQALRHQEIDMALVGGVSLYLTPGSYIGMCSAGMLSPDGQCKTCDASANGFVPGEGVGALVLKRLADAEADHDQIYGVIIGSGMNQDGTTNGITAPSVNSQMELERGIYEKYQIDPASISYVEMHGTGTKLGDPIELEALATVFQKKTQRKQYCAIGSVKSNIGHTSAAAGVAGVQKVLLAMKEKKLVPTLHFQQPNEHFDFAASPFYVNTQVQDWQSEAETPLRAAVSSFGFSGTNAHLVIEEYIPSRDQTDTRHNYYDNLQRRTDIPCLFVLSAKSASQLKSYAQEMKRWIQVHAELALQDIAFTLQLGRDALDYRLAIVADSREALLQKLEAFINGQTATGLYTAQVKKSLEAAVGIVPCADPVPCATGLDLPFSSSSPGNEAILFDADEDGQSLLHIWCQKRNVEKLARVWVRGVSVDWNLLYGSAQGTIPTEMGSAQGAIPTVPNRPHRISLPTYPFAHQSYWLPTSTSNTMTYGVNLPVAQGIPMGETTVICSTEDREDEQVQDTIPTERLISVLKQMVSRLLKVKIEEIDVETSLSEYGFASITFTKLADSLNQTFQLDLTPAIFFEHSTIERLSQYLLVNYASVLTSVSKGGWGWPPSGEGTSPSSTLRHGNTPEPSKSRGVDDELASSRPLLVPVPTPVSVSTPASTPLPVNTSTPIAIIGMSGMFPHAPDMQSLWNNLLEGRDCIGEIPASRWDWQTTFSDLTTEEKTNIKWAGVMEGIELFDPLFFGISPREAEQMDPQQRLLMIYVWKAIEDAGYSASSLSGTNTALFVATGNSGYNERIFRANMAIDGHASTGLTASVGPNRVSYFLNLHGPSEAIDTACSSSLVAIHRGVSAIESGECSIAIVGGVNILVSPEAHLSLSKAGMLSEDGRCKSFSAQANGYVRGEGVGMLVLKKLSAAEQAGDQIYAVIRGSAENHGGRASSLTAPNPRAQADLLVTAYSKAGIDPCTVSYIEAHGTGTALGDPIEINALKTAWSELVGAVPCVDPVRCSEEGPMPRAMCGIGTVKSNIGHLELAAGVAGVIKVLLQMRHKMLVKSLHCEQINPYIQLEGSPFYIMQENREWEALRDSSGNILPRRAGVSSFGFGGVNAHVVLEEYLPMPRATDGGKPRPYAGSLAHVPGLIVLSAKNEERLHEQAQQLLAWVAVGTGPCARSVCTEEALEQVQDRCEASDRGVGACSCPLSLQDLAYTLQVGREAMEERLGMLVGSLQELQEKLQSYLQEPQGAGDWYRGQVKQYKEMVSLFNTDKDIQEAIDKWLQHGKYEKLLHGWVKGLTIDWKQLYREHLPRRVSLPTYPFARERYWISANRRDSTLHLSTSDVQPETQTSTPVTKGTGSAQGTTPTVDRINGSGKALSTQNRVALRPLTDHAVLSMDGANIEEDRAGSLCLVSCVDPEPCADPVPTVPFPTLKIAQLEEELARSLAQALYMEQNDIDVEVPYVDMGLDSVIGVEWIQSLNKQYVTNLAVSCVYDYPTIHQLAGFLQKELLRQREATPQTPLQSKSSLSLDESVTAGIGKGASSQVDPAPGGSLHASVGTRTGASPVPTASRGKEAIAIVGMSGKYPDASNLTDFWENLVQGKNGVREIPLSRFNVSDYYDQSPGAYGKTYSKWLGALDEIEYFDPLFFHLSPAEAEVMDPQQRLFLEEGYKAFEDAGYSPQLLSNRKCGVYLGLVSYEYGLLLSEHNVAGADLLGTSSAIAAARLAYLLNLKGPAIAIDTACSSSLVATHLACQALRSQEIDMALVGGGSLCLTPGFYVRMCATGMLSPDGQCKTFDASANGFVPGEGVGALVLKRLEDAEADHDQIYGVIIGSGMNQDGVTNGITAPSVKSQIALEREVYEKYQIDPESISYVEMHGTGTKLGDPIELEALATVFQEKTQRKQYCAIGSVKSNIGHTLAAAGVASMHKVLLAMKHKMLVPTLHFRQPNEHFDFEASPFYMNTQVKDWESVVGVPRRAAVSSFGFSGTNTHLVIEEYLPDRSGELASPSRNGACPLLTSPEIPSLFVLSAKSEQQLKSYAQEMKQWIQGHSELALEDIAFTLQLGREALDHRLAFVADSREILLQRLEQFVDKQASTGIYTAQVKRNLGVGLAPDPTSPPGNDAMLFEADEDGQSLLHIWCQKRNLEKLAQVWVRGVNVDWKLLYTVEAGLAPALPHRVSLPTYPFAREHYWFPNICRGGQGQAAVPTSLPLSREDTRRGSGLSLSQTYTERSSVTPLGDASIANEHLLRLVPHWDLIVLPQQPSTTELLAAQGTRAIAHVDPTNQIVIVGGTADEQSTIIHTYPQAHILEIPTGASIEHIAQRLQELGAIGTEASPIPTALGATLQTLHVFWLAPHDPQPVLTQESILAAQQQGVMACFRLIKALLQLGYGNRILRWTVITRQTRTLYASETGHPTHASLLGLFGSLAKEYIHWSIQQVDLSITASLPLAEILRLPADPQGDGWLYRNGHWYRQTLISLDVPSFERREAYRRGGVYVVLGGAGGIGEVWSEYLICRYQAQMIWIGRRTINAEILAKQERLAALGPRPYYLTADATNQSALQQAYQEIKRNFGQIHGVIHSAIVLLDQSLANMDEERFQAALAAKVDVSVRLAQVFEHELLDFVLFFSSLNAFARNAGQSNYVAGCTFEDAFAAQLGRDWPCAVKVMNWGYWGNVGVVASREYRERMAQTGVGSIEPAEAMEALEHLLTGPVNQMALLKLTELVSPEKLIQTEEMARGYGPENLPSFVHNLERCHPDVQRNVLDAETLKAMQEMEELLYKLLWSHLQSLGLFREKHAVLIDQEKQVISVPSSGSRKDIDSCRPTRGEVYPPNPHESSGNAISYNRWLQESITLLERQGYLHRDGDTVCTVSEFLTPIDGATLWQHWDQHKEHWTQNANLKAQTVLVETMLRALPNILTGKRSATEIMFPNGSMQLVEGVYQQNMTVDYYNDLLAQLLVTYLQERLTHEEHAHIRILEIGAGTGGTTSKVLQMLQPYQSSIAEYCYSDISEAFLQYGQWKYAAEYPYLTYQRFNVEKPLAEQGIEEARYDVVIATNVLHATSNICRTVHNANDALKKHGLLLLNEITGTNLFFHLTFGLLEGWWAYEDPELRVPGCPALSTENWKTVLSSEGFETIYHLPALAMQEAAQQVIASVKIATNAHGPKHAPHNQHLNPIKLHESLKHLASRLLRVQIEEIDTETRLSEYGFDSITFIQFAHQINQTYQLDLTPALFYEHSTIERLAQYLQATYASVLAPHFAVGTPVATLVPESTPALALTPVSTPLPVNTSTPIAIIGMSGLFPQSPDLQSFWNNLVAGHDCIGEIPASRWDWQSYFGDPSSCANKTNIKWAGVIEDIEIFDPLFFGISKAEAEQMDPQQRLLMMYVWKAIEDAGYAASTLSGTNTALFVGTGSSGYGERISRAHMAIEGYSSTGLAPAVGPNRMSYFLNLHGPSEPIDTACSSSLVAIHRGVNAIESGQCTLAIVGGVNTLISPETHISLSKAGMLSSDGRCKSFGASANGFVRSEGVGMLVLKKLSDAEQAGDHIYAVIRGSAENHGGRASSLTAPNPRAQADMLIAAYRKAGIDPTTVGYVEAHGTGTVLGDPIEINGLKTAFSELVQQRGVRPSPYGELPIPPATCGIGSVKSNIGHLELASGVAGVIKVLLQMQHKTLVKSLHCGQINPYIQLEDSPFYIVQENREWEAPRDHEGNVLPRRAGVSSFGVGGVNAHVVLEEYMPKPKATHSISCPQPPTFIVLSARDEERLREQAQQLLAWTRRDADDRKGSSLKSLSACATEGSSPQIEDFAYTLQVGREAMEERLAFQVSSFAELEDKLHKYLQGPQEAGNWYRGQVRRHKETVALLNADEGFQETIDKWLQSGKYETLLQWWVKGLKVEWQRLYTVGMESAQGPGSLPHPGSAQGAIPTAPALPRRISLPTYPFARERCWISIGTSSEAELHAISTSGSTGSTTAIQAATSFPALHPLVQRNTSTLWEQQFSSIFHGDEFFLTDHVIGGQRIMPGVAYLEMARAAVSQAIATDMLQETDKLCLNHVVWVCPLVCAPEHPITVHITLTPQENGTIAFAISRASIPQQEESGELTLLCQGTALVGQDHLARQADKLQGTVGLNTSQTLDLPAIQSRCQHQFSGTECYQRYRALGVNYGVALQGIEQMVVGDSEVLARFRLPAMVEQTSTDFVLHPSVLDAAIHASIGMSIEPVMYQEPQVPFALEQFSIVGEVPTQGWAWVRLRSDNIGQLKGQVSYLLDVEVCDDAGRVAVRLQGLSTRPLPTKEESRTILLVPNWQEEETTLRGSGLSLPACACSLVLLCNLPGIEASRIQAQLAEGGLCRNLNSQQPRREQHFQDIALQLTQELQHLLQSRPTGSVLIQVIMTYREEPSLLEALAGVLKTAHQEYPRLRGQLIEVEEEPEERELLACLHENQHIAQEGHIRYRGGKRGVRVWQEVSGDNLHPNANVPAKIPWKEGGCYLITGGAGGLARLFVQEIARHIQAATIILVGRSALTVERHALLDAVGADRASPLWELPCADSVSCTTDVQNSSDGIHIDYQQVDVTDGLAVQAFIQKVLAKSGRIDGIIHAAGALRDSLLLNKTQREVQAVLAPKVIGVELLDEASSQIPLDFFILCSSLSAVVGNVGQADYAAANAYLDAFAHARQAQVLAGKRKGATLSINWPLWEEGGMQIDVSKRQMMQDWLGAEIMGTETGMTMLYQALACGQAQVMIAHGQVERIKQRLRHHSPILPMEAALIEHSTDPSHEGVQQLQSTDLRTDLPFGPQLLHIPIAFPLDPLGFGEYTSLGERLQKYRSFLDPLEGTEIMDKLHEALKHTVSHLLKVRVEEIDIEIELAEYGFDSITFTAMANRLNQTYQLDLTPTTFYEHSTIERLAQYLQATYATLLAPHFMDTPSHVVAQESLTSATTGTTNAVPSSRSVPRWRTRLARMPMQMPEQKAPAATEPVAIIGISGSFPQAPDIPSLWSNLLAGRDCIGEIPASRWDWQTYFDRSGSCANKTNIKWAGVMEGVDLFDPLFFGISPREAEQMDPQQRLLMMHVWKAIEDAGYSASSLSGTDTALFVGTGSSGYSEQLSRTNMAIEGYSSTGSSPSVGPNRMSYFLNLHGPSEPIETACSSSLVAIHRGVNAIESGQCSMAIVGGVNILVSPETHVSLSKAGMLSEDGRCKSFGASANGYVRGEGVGMLVLKRLSDAEQAGDHIYAVVRASAENHGGRASSLTAPNPRAQADLLIAAYRKAEIDPHTVGYIEAHSTGTELGDPIEINALKTAFDELRTGTRHSPYDEEEGLLSQAWCGIGSVKSNIGHLELAAGVAGVIKVLLQMQHKTLVKSLHCEQINPYIQLEASPFYIVQENRTWEAPRDHAGNILPRRAGVSSFGFGGVNAHVVLEEYVPKPKIARSVSPAPPFLIVLSARTEERLHERVRQLLTWMQVGICAEESLEQAPDRHEAPDGGKPYPSLRDLAYTLQVGREVMEERLALQVNSLAELEEQLRKYVEGEHEGGNWYRGRVKRHDVVSLFAADEDGQKAIAAWMSKGKYGKLLELWVKGLSIDWKLLYTVGAESEISIASVLPRRISLPTYPFAQNSYWIPIPTSGNGQAQDTAPAALPQGPTSNSTAVATSRSVALRPLVDPPVLSRRDSGQGQALPLQSLPACPGEADQLQPSIILSLSGQPFSQSSSSNNVTPAPVPMTEEPRTQADQGQILSEASSLEEELARSLAQALYMEPHDIDVEIPFGDMGLDSVSGVEWIRSLNEKYTSNLAVSCIYAYPTIRQLVGFLQKELLKHQQAPAQTMAPLSLDDVLQQVQQGNLDLEKAEALLNELEL